MHNIKIRIVTHFHNLIQIKLYTHINLNVDVFVLQRNRITMGRKSQDKSKVNFLIKI